MSSKSSNKKSGGNKITPWYYCDLCDVYVSHKERDHHETECPITTGDAELSLEYIYKNVLYTTSVEERKFVIEDIKDLPENVINQLVFVSEGVMHLNSWHISQRIMIKSLNNNEVPIVRSLWPIPDKFLTTVLVNKEDYNYYFSSKNRNVYEVKAIPKGQPYLCSRISLKILNDELKKSEDEYLNQIQLRDLTRLLKRYLNNRCFVEGTRIFYDFFNKNLELEIQGMWRENSFVESNLENMFNKLTTEDVLIYKINHTTNIEILNVQLNKEDGEGNNTSVKTIVNRRDIGGLISQIELIEESLDFAMGVRAVPKGVKVSRGLLLYGPSGCGKTMICEAMCNRLEQQFIKIATIKPLILKVNTGELFSKFLGESEKKLYYYFQQVYTHYPNPTLIIIEDIQNLCPKTENSEILKRVSLAFVNFLDELNNKSEGQKSFVLTTTLHVDLISANLRRAGRLDIEVEISPPTPKERKEIFQCLLRKISNHRIQDADIEELAQITHAYVGADIANVIYNASLKALKRCNSSSQLNLTIDDVKASLNSIKPSAMREVLIECPNVRWSDIGGQENLKVILQQAIDWPFKHAEQFKRLGIKPPRGILMYGPPGCSKTMIAKAVATESHLNFLSIKGPELFSMWVGESERAVREVFRKARQVAPAIIFFDEIDAIGSERSCDSSNGSGTSVKERVLTQLLTELDGVEPLKNVTVIAATNRPDMIDKALLRPGRFDRIIYVGLPNELARHEIFKIKLQKVPLANDVNIEKLVEQTDGYTGAEIEAICHEASLKALEDDFDASEVCWSQFEYALHVVQPRTSEDLLRLYDNYGKKR